MLTLSDGSFGSRGLGQSCGSPSWPAVVAAGVYDDSPDPTLLAGPIWGTIELEPDDGWVESAALDLRDAVLTSRYTHQDSGEVVTCTKFASASRRGVVAMRVDGPSESICNSSVLIPPPTTTAGVHVAANADHVTHHGHGDVSELSVTSSTGAVGAAGIQQVVDRDGRRSLTRLAVYRAGAPIDMAAAHTDVCSIADVGFDRLLAEHRGRWHQRWELARTDISDDPELDTAVKFAEYHLLACANDHDDDAAIGARGLTGPSYNGHVFWDTEVFVVPALAAMAPRSARAALTYRWRRLDAAREQALRRGRSGARFPWESAGDGRDVTPRQATTLHGDVVPILTGDLEEHIVADVAWAVVRYFDWSGDNRFMRSIGVTLLAETARYWESRIEVDADGSGHLRDVIGPDEYHERVDDNAFTNVMAGYNLRVASEHCGRFGGASTAERRHWQDLSERIVDGLDPETGVYEQFEGFDRLAPTLVSSIGTPPLNADVVLGHDVVQASQIIKQPDVLMLHHLIPDDVAPGTLVPNLDRYLPRTAHGSSLSPAVCAGLLARARRTSEAVRWFRLAALLDLDEVTGASTMGGVHLATMGGVWQALTHGFLGLRLTATGLTLDPLVPDEWGTVAHRVQFRNTPITIEAGSDSVCVTAARHVEVGLGDGHDSRSARSHEFRRTTRGWERR
jgi:trehalose/maltose hydrolase-like predicted phosphorylase